MDMRTKPTGVTPLEESLPILNRLLSPYTGIAHLRFHMMAQPSDPRMWHVTCLAADSELTIGASVPLYSGGIHPERDRAVAAALGEAAERYSLSYVPFESFRFCSARELGEPHVPTATLNFFSVTQYESSDKFSPFDDETPVQWALGKDLRTGEPAWIPSVFCYLPDHRRDGEPRIAYSTSSGVACAPTFAEALLGGLYELIERDAFLLMWYNRLAMPVLDCSDIPQIEFNHRTYYNVNGLRYTAVDLSEFSDVPSAMAIVRDETRYVKLAVGAASARTMTDAVGKAVREAFQTYAWARQMRFLNPDWTEPDPEFSQIRDFEDHVALHAFGEYEKESTFMDACPLRRHVSEVSPVSGAAVSDQIEALVARLNRRGMDVYAIDVTAPDLRDLGLHVVRAFCPQLCQIDSDHKNRFLGIDRIYGGALAEGLLARRVEPAEINHFPHPFP
jgi:ribosomal protein S12 methylthiotransferase accessory factor